MRMTRFVTLLLLPLFSLLTIYLPTVVDAGEFKVSIENDTLSVAAEKIALQTIILELFAEGVTVKIYTEINPLKQDGLSFTVKNLPDYRFQQLPYSISTNKF